MTKTIKRKDFLRIVRDVCGDEYPELIKSAKKQTNTCYDYAGDNGSNCLVGYYLAYRGMPTDPDSRSYTLEDKAKSEGLAGVGERFSDHLVEYFGIGQLGATEEVVITTKFSIVHEETGVEYKVRLPMGSDVYAVRREYLRAGYPAGRVRFKSELWTF